MHVLLFVSLLLRFMNICIVTTSSLFATRQCSHLHAVLDVFGRSRLVAGPETEEIDSNDVVAEGGEVWFVISPVID